MGARWWAVAVVALLPMVAGNPAATADDCGPGAMPYGDLPGASLVAEVRVSVDAEPVRYVRWRGTVPGFDGMPFSVDVTVPCGAAGPLPAVLMLHGFTDDKEVWQEDGIESPGRPGSNSHWNNVWFASRGYAVVNYTARGWHDSCGPDTPGATVLVPSLACLPFEYWLHLDDLRWEVRDAQWLAGGLVQSGVADPARLAITGGSYGGAPTAAAALLAGTTVCGGSPVPPALGPDPCAGRADGELAAWTTPDGTTPLTWAAAVPMYTFSDLLQVLAPNGRATDGWSEAPPDQDAIDPFGVPVLSTITGLLAAGATTGFYAPPALDPDADIVVDTARLLAGNPFPLADPLVARGIDVYRTFKSPLTVEPRGRVPIFWVQGLTDPLFSGLEAVRLRNRLPADYPFTLFLGDLGHDYAGERKDEWDLAHERMNAFLDHHLRPDRTPTAPTGGAGATITRCLDHDAPLRVVDAPTWHDLHPTHRTFTSDATGVTNTLTPGPAGLATDPITGATLPLPGSYKGCRIMRPAQADPTVATYEFPLDTDVVLLGGPVVDIAFTTTGPDVPLSVRLWDVAADGSAQGLVTRGTYRVVEGPASTSARFQLAPQGYRFPAGHRLKVEVTANDVPYHQASNVPAVVTVTGLEVVVPLALDAEAAAPAVPVEPAAEPARPAAPGLPATGALPTTVALLAMAVALGLRARRPSGGEAPDAPKAPQRRSEHAGQYGSSVAGSSHHSSGAGSQSGFG